MTALMALCYIAAEVLRVGFKAFWNVLILVPAAAVAVAPGPQRQFAKKAALRAVVHGLEMMFATAGLGVLLILMRHVMHGNFAGGVQVTSPLLKLLMLVLLSWASALAFRKMLHAFGDGGLPTPMSMTRGLVKVGMAGATPLAQMQQFRSGASRRMGREFGPSDSAHLPGHAGEQGSAGPANPAAAGIRPSRRPRRRPRPAGPAAGDQRRTPPRVPPQPRVRPVRHQQQRGPPPGATPPVPARPPGAIGRATGSGAATAGRSATTAAGSATAATTAARASATAVAPEVVAGAMVAESRRGDTAHGGPLLGRHPGSRAVTFTPDRSVTGGPHRTARVHPRRRRRPVIRTAFSSAPSTPPTRPPHRRHRRTEAAHLPVRSPR